jgi:hypothetical protein
MSAAEAPTDQTAKGRPGPAQAFGMVLNATVGSVAAKLERKTAGLIDKLGAVAGKGASSDAVVELADEGLDAVADSGGVAQRAGAEGVKAHMHGESPVWAVIRGVWQAGSPAVKAAIVTSVAAAVVLLLVSPVLLIVYLLSWLVIAAVAQSRSAHQRHAEAA